jgi:hypothetical protein
VRCAPCVVDARGLAARPVRIAEVEASIEHGEMNQLRGVLRADRVRAAWRGRLGAQGIDLELKLADAPVADLVALLGAAVPEAAQARIEGRAGATVRLAAAVGRYAIEPRLDGLAVSGSRHRGLLAASPAARVRALAARPAQRGAVRRLAAEGGDRRRGPALPRARRLRPRRDGGGVVERAARSQRRAAARREHDLAAARQDALRRRRAHRGAQGARAALAVELDRTLGKARVLQLYLSVVPWGDGQCGAEAAALHYFGKRAAALDAAEAVWIASLLRNPELELDRAANAFDATRARRSPARCGRCRSGAARTCSSSSANGSRRRW